MKRAVLVCVLALTAACADSPAAPTPREVIAQWERDAEHPAVVPTTVPAGYRLVFPPRDYFGPSGAAGIAVCALPVVEDPAGSCVGTNDDSPWFSTTTVDGALQVIVQTTTGGATEHDLDPWRDLVYTTELDGLAWLDEGPS